jgi:hypothetical protein
MVPTWIPPPGLVDSTLVIDGRMQLFGALVLVVLLAAYAALLAAIRSTTRARERLRCPIDGRRAAVVFRLGPGRTRARVVRCSLLGRRGTCSRRCLDAA